MSIENEIKKHSKLIFGAWQFGGGYFKQVEENDAKNILKKAYEMGIRNIDTARAYGNGVSERIIGDLIKNDFLRENIFLSSKCYPMEIDDFKKNFKESLKSLGTEYIDVYYIHWPRDNFDLRPMAEFLEEMREEGRIKYLGISNFELRHMESVSSVCKVDIHQIGYNPLFRNKEEGVIPYCIKNNISMVSYSTIAQGLLSGKKIESKNVFDDSRGEKLILFRDEVWPETLKTLKKLEEIASDSKLTMLELTYAWLKKTSFTGFIVGFSKEQYVESNINAFKSEISDEVAGKMTKILDELMPYTKNFLNLFNRAVYP